MQSRIKKFRWWTLLLLVMVMAAGVTCRATSKDVQAATKTGFRKENGKPTTTIPMVRNTKDG